MNQGSTNTFANLLHMLHNLSTRMFAHNKQKLAGFTIILLSVCLTGCFDNESKEETPKPYAENIDYDKEVTAALKELKNQQRLMLVFGANWCPSCRRLDASLTSPDITDYLKTNFKIIKVNVGNFDKNLHIAHRFKLPIRQGIPAMVIVKKDETVAAYIKTQELAVLHKKGRKTLYHYLRKI